MRTFGFSLAVLALLAAPALQAQPAAPEPCSPSATLDQLIHALDAAVSGPADKDRTCMRALLLPEARLTPLSPQPDGGLAPHILTLDGWIAAVQKRGKAVLYEHQVKVETQVYGHIAHLWSTYELHLDKPDGKPAVRGINSIQAVYDGSRWKVFEILWQAETPAEPVPEKYLP